MPPGPEDIAREQIDRMLIMTGWAVYDAKAVTDRTAETIIKPQNTQNMQKGDMDT